MTAVPQDPAVYLVVNDRKSASDDNFCCSSGCNFLAYVRVSSSPSIEIPINPKATFEIDNRAISLEYYLLEYAQVGSDYQFQQSDSQLKFDESAALLIDWPEGENVLAVTAGWKSTDEN